VIFIVEKKTADIRTLFVDEIGACVAIEVPLLVTVVMTAGDAEVLLLLLVPLPPWPTARVAKKAEKSTREKYRLQ